MKIEKIKYFIHSLMFLSLHLTIYGCSDSPLTNTQTGTTYKALTERDFADKNLKAEPGAVIVLNLEDKNSPSDPEWFDTDLIGVDIIPIRYTETAKHHFKIDEESGFEMSLMNDSSKQVLFELTQQNEEIDVMIPAGDYLMIITSLEDFKPDSLGSQVVFIQPDTEATGSANTDYDPAQLNILLSTKRCSRCNLRHANLSRANLYLADLSYADLDYANLFLTDLRNANLSNAHLYLTDLGNANLSSANLTASNLTSAKLTNAKLTDAKLTNAKLRNTSLKMAFLRNTDFINAELRNVDLEFAVGNANFSSAKFKDVNLTKGFFQDAKFINADLNDVDFTRANLIRADLSGANIKNSVFINVQLYYANFCGATFSGVIASGNIGHYSARCWPLN